MNSIKALFSKACSHFYNEIMLLHGMHSRLIPIETARLGKMLESYDLLFLEDAVAAQSHIDTWAPNFLIQKFVGFGTKKCNEVFSCTLP